RAERLIDVVIANDYLQRPTALSNRIISVGMERRGQKVSAPTGVADQPWASPLAEAIGGVQCRGEAIDVIAAKTGASRAPQYPMVPFPARVAPPLTSSHHAASSRRKPGSSRRELCLPAQHVHMLPRWWVL